MILNLAIVAQAAIYGIFEDNTPRLEPRARPHDYPSILPFIPKIGFAFEYQVYFLIVYPYLSKRNIVQKGTQLAVTTSTLMLAYCAGFSGLSLLSHQIVLNSYGIVELQYTRIEVGTRIMDWTIILSQFL